VSLVWHGPGDAERYKGDCVGREIKQSETVMIWAAIAWGIKGPLDIWSIETDEEKAHAEKEIACLNKEMREESEKLDREWKQSQEWRDLKARQLAENRRATRMAKELGVPKSWMPATWRGVQRNKRDRGGIDSWRYIQHVCLPLFWPWLQKHDLLLMDDNAPAHASQFTASMRELYQILHLEWPPNSPNLNPIEHSQVTSFEKVKLIFVT